MKTKRKPEFIIKNGKPSAVIIGIDDYKKFLQLAEDKDDLKELENLRKEPQDFIKWEDLLKEL